MSDTTDGLSLFDQRQYACRPRFTPHDPIHSDVFSERGIQALQMSPNIYNTRFLCSGDINITPTVDGSSGYGSNLSEISVQYDNMDQIKCYVHYFDTDRISTLPYIIIYYPDGTAKHITWCKTIPDPISHSPTSVNWYPNGRLESEDWDLRRNNLIVAQGFVSYADDCANDIQYAKFNIVDYRKGTVWTPHITEEEWRDQYGFPREYARTTPGVHRLCKDGKIRPVVSETA